VSQFGTLSGAFVRPGPFWLPVLLALASLAAQTPPPAPTEAEQKQEVATFRTDVSLVRVDVQVLDSNHRPVTGLRREDFVVRDSGRPREIRSFVPEEMPVDVLLLLDVSGSMRPHVERVAAASRSAMDILTEDDRVAIMVFDRRSRVRMPFRSSADEVERAFTNLLGQERFNGGTDITRGLLDAAEYVGRNARKDARRAVIILTDDRTGGERDEITVGDAFARAEAVLMALITPDSLDGPFRRPGGGTPPTWPTSWPGAGGTLGDIIFGRRGGGPPIVIRDTQQSAGTSEIARESGGESFPVGQAESLETVLNRIRQRYSIYFQAAPGALPGRSRAVEVVLAGSALRRNPSAQLRYRGSYIAPGNPGDPPSSQAEVETISVSQANSPDSQAGAAATAGGTGAPATPPRRRRTVLTESEGPRGPNPSVGAAAETSPSPPSRTADAQSAAPVPAAPRKGWRTVDEPEPAPAPPPKPVKPPGS
jgi:VWFA-related protein